MKTWQVTGKAWSVLRSSLPIVGLIFGIQLILGLIGLPLVNLQDTLSAGQTAFAIILGLVNFFLWPLIQAGCLAFSNDVLSGNTAAVKSPIPRFLDGGKRSYWRVLAFGLLWGLVCVLVVILGAALFAAATALGAKTPAAGVLLVILTLIPLAVAAYLLILTTAAGPMAIVVEHLGVMAAIRRGIRVGRALIWRFILVSLAVTVTLLPAIGLAMLLAYVQGDAAQAQAGWRIVNLLIQSVLNSASVVLFTIAFVLVYRNYLHGSSAATAS